MTTKSYELSQTEAAYVPVSTQAGQMCANCRWFCMEEGAGDCRIVEDYPQPIMQTGYCNRWEEIPMMNSEPVEVVIVEPEMDMGEMSQPPPTPGLVGRVVNTFKNLIMPKQSDAPFQVIKTQGGYRWIAAFSNNFQDRDEEIISEKAWDGYLGRIEKGLVPMPELWIGHVQGTRHGVADMVFGAGNFVVATGTFDDTDIARAALKYYLSPAGKDIPLSHGFTFPKWAFKDGIYEVVNTFEITTLPPPLVASNPFTEYEVFSMKQIDPNQRAALEKMLGNAADSILANYEKGSEEIKAAGVAYKAFTDTEPPAFEAPANEPMAALLADILAAQGDMAKMLTVALKALDGEKAKAATLTARLDKLESALSGVQTELRLTPRAASSAGETKLTDKQTEEVKKDFPSEYDPFFGSMGVPLKR